MNSSSISIKEERPDEAEIRELAAKLVTANNKIMELTMARQLTKQMKLAGCGKQTTKYRKTTDDSDDDSFRGRFSWIQLGECYIPFIFRTGEKYCSVRMVEMKLLNKYLNHLHQDIYSHIDINSFYVTESESKLLNEINIIHCDNQFGRDLFTTRDLIVKLSDAKEFYNFLNVCYSKLIKKRNPNDRCGFLLINKKSVVPYTVKNDSKYVPLFYFESETENLHLKADQLEGWDLSYLKFCCKVQGIKSELLTHDTCTVMNLNTIKRYFLPETIFEEYWPSKVMESLLLNGENSRVGGQWTRRPLTPPIEQMCTGAMEIEQHHHTSNVYSQPVQAMYNDVVGDQPTFQNVSANSALKQAVHMDPSYYPLTPLIQASPSLTPLIPSVNQVPPITRTATFTSSTGTSAVDTRTSTTATQNVKMIQDLNRTTQAVSSVVEPTTTAVQSNVWMNQSYPPPLIPVRSVNTQPVSSVVAPATTAVQSNVGMNQSYPPPLIPVRGINTQPVSSVVASATTAVQANVYQSNPPPSIPVNSSPRNSTYPNTNNTLNIVHLSAINFYNSRSCNNVLNNNQSHLSIENRKTSEIDKKLTQITELYISSPNIPYKINKIRVEGKWLPCINMKPLVWSEQLVTLPDFVQHFFNAVPFSSCRCAMDELGIELYRGNRHQRQILQESGLYESVNNLALVRVHDVTKYMPQIKYMLSNLLN